MCVFRLYNAITEKTEADSFVFICLHYRIKEKHHEHQGVGVFPCGLRGKEHT